jgi:flagellar motor switch protein FliG
MSPIEKEALLKAIGQTDAIFALEGFEPTEQRKLINEAVLAGRVSHSQAIEEMLDFIKKHKTVRGFVESRSWA